MPNKVRIHGGHAAGGMKIGTVAQLPASPGLGFMVTHNGDTLLYTTIDGIESYFPIVKGAETAAFRMSYPVSNLVWELEHNLNTKEFFMVIKDHEDNIIMTYEDLEFVTGEELNKVRVHFAEPVRGTALLIASKSMSTPRLNTSEITFSEEFSINANGLVYNGQVIPVADLANLNGAITTATGIANTAKTTADTALSRANSAITTADAVSLQVSNQAGQISTVTGTANAAKTTADAAALAVAGKLDLNTFLTSFAPYDIGFGSDDAITVGLNIGGGLIARKSRIPANFAGSFGKVDVAPTIATTFSVQKNGVQVGVISIAPGAMVFTFSSQAAIDLNPGDRIKILAANADSTLKGIDGVLVNNLIQ